MRYSTGSRISFNNKNCTVVITDQHGNPLIVKSDTTDKLFDVKENDVVSPIIQK